MHSAAGGTSQRLKPALAMMRSRSRIPTVEPIRPPACSIVVIGIYSLWRALLGALLSGSGFRSSGFQSLDCLAHVRLEAAAASLDMREDREAHARIPEFLDVIGRAGDRRVGSLAGEK